MPSGFRILHRLAVSSLLLGSVITGAAAAPADTPGSDAYQAAPLKRLVVLDFKLTGDPGGDNFTAAHRQRLVMAGAKLREALKRNRLYRVVDDPAATALIARWGAQQNLHQCNGCELDLAKRLQAEQILLPWVFRMSNLVLTLHVEVRDAATGRISMKRALDFRGDNDTGWLHAIDYLIKDLQENED